MSKVLRTVAVVTGAAALIVTGVGALGGGAAIASLGLGSAASIAATASAVASVASIGAQITAKRPTSERQGVQTVFKIDPGAPIPLVMGRTAVGGTMVFRKTYGKDNGFKTYASVLTAGGPARSIQFLADRVPVGFLSSSAAVGFYAGWLWHTSRLGANPDSALTPPAGLSSSVGVIPSVPGWSASHRMSGYATAMHTLLFDKKGSKYASGEPAPMWVVERGLVYDPRLDSTFPGGSGPCRWASPSDPAAHAAARATWVYSETPALHELMWALGVWQRNEANPAAPYRKIMGIGAPIDLIDVAAYTEAANVQEANGWKIGGEVTSAQRPWDVLKLIAATGCSEPLPLGARLSTMVETPRVPVGAIGRDDLVDVDSVVPAVRPRRERLNGYRVRIRSEAHGWEMVPLDIVQVPEYVTADGREHTGSEDLPLVQNADQGASIAAYRVFNSRELGPISLTLKPRCAAYRVRDCVTLNLPELGLVNQPAIIRRRRIDPATGIVTMSFRTETIGKHAAALGQTGVVPPEPVLTVIDDEPAAPDAGDWTATGGVRADGAFQEPAITLNGLVGNPAADGVVIEVRQAGTTPWTLPRIEPQTATQVVITGLQSDTAYEVSVAYRVRGVIGARRVLGPVTTGTQTGGVDAVLIKLEASQLVARLDAAGNYVGGPITFTVERQNTTEAVTWRYLNSTGETIFAGTSAEFAAAFPGPTGFSTTGPDNLTVTALGVGSIIATHGAIKLVVDVPSGPSSRATVVPVGDGENGLPGADGAPGAPGANGTSSFTHYAYANSIPPGAVVDFTTGAPGDRAFEGVYVDSNPADSTDPNAYSWREYKGPPFGLAARGFAVVAGNQIIKVDGPLAWDSDAYSTVGYRGACSTSFRFSDNAYVMAGINTDPTAALVGDAAYATLDHAWFGQPEGECSIWDGGAFVSSHGPYTSATIFQIIYTGSAVRYLKDGVVVREVAKSADILFFFDSAFAAAGSRILDVTWSAAGRDGRDGADGLDGLPGAPGVPGAPGASSYTHYAYANSVPPATVVDFTTGAPGDRAFEGVYVDSNPADSTDPNAYTWREYKGPPFGLAARGLAVVAGNQIIKPDGPTVWDSDAYSTVGYRGACSTSFRFTANATAMAGINTDPTAPLGGDAAFTQLDHAWFAGPDGICSIWESGTGISTYGPYTADTVFQVIYTGSFVRYLKDGVVVREVAKAAEILFFLDSAFAAAGSRILDVTWSAAGRDGRDGRDGLDGSDGLPGPPGTNGATSYIHIAYANSADGTVDFTTGAAGGRYFIGTYTDFNPADSTNPASYTWSPWRGADGTNGVPGAPGADGTPSYVHIAYANSADGTVDFDLSNPDGRRYIGVYTDSNPADSTNPASYTWSLIKGADGATPFTADLSVAAVSIAATYLGVPKAGELPRAIAVTVRQGTTLITSGASVAAAPSAGITTSVSGTTVSIDDATADGHVDVTVSVGGTAIATRRVPVQLIEDGPPGADAEASQGVTLNGSYSVPTTGTTENTIATQTRTISAGGKIRITPVVTAWSPGSSFPLTIVNIRFRIAGTLVASAQVSITGDPSIDDAALRALAATTFNNPASGNVTISMTAARAGPASSGGGSISIQALVERVA